MNTKLYILFREYSDSSICPTALYINSDSYTSADEWLNWYNGWIQIANFFKYERCDRYFDADNLRQALYPFDLLEEYYQQKDEFPNIVDSALSQLFSLGFINWRDEYDDSGTDTCHWNKIDVTNHTFGEIARSIRSGYSAILLNADAINHPSPIRITYSNGYCCCQIEHSCDLKSMHRWFSNCRTPQRVFQYSDKHGDKYTRAQMIHGTTKQAAQLESTKEEAQSLLNLAIGIDPTSSLWYYDTDRQKHIYFENQNERRMAFHGYHLIEGEENYNNISKNKLSFILGISYDKVK